MKFITARINTVQSTIGCLTTNWVTTAMCKLKASLPIALYHCKEIVYATNGSLLTQNDFAIVRLDRPVVGRKPSRAFHTHVGDWRARHDDWLPDGDTRQISGPAPVISNPSDYAAFITRLSAFDGNSGSAVFDLSDQVIGILVSGRPGATYVEDSVQQCSRLNRCDANGENCLQNDIPDKNAPPPGSDVQRIAPVVQKLLELNQVSAL